MDSRKDEIDLCRTCEQLDFQFLFGASSRETVAKERTLRSTMFETGICLGSTAELRERSYCKLCRLVFEMLRTVRSDGKIPFEKDHQQIICYLKTLVRDCTGLQLDASKALATDRPFAFQLLIKTQPSIVEEYDEELRQDLPPPLLIQKISEEVKLESSYYGRELPSLHEFINLSQATLAHADSDPAWDEETESYAGKKGGPPIKSKPPLDAEDELFDQERYDPNISWCLYNVMMIDWQEGVAYRVGIGQMHIHAFDSTSSQFQKILLG